MCALAAYFKEIVPVPTFVKFSAYDKEGAVRAESLEQVLAQIDQNSLRTWLIERYDDGVSCTADSIFSNAVFSSKDDVRARGAASLLETRISEGPRPVSSSSKLIRSDAGHELDEVSSQPMGRVPTLDKDSRNLFRSILDNKWLVGITCSVLGSLIIGFATLLIKYVW